MHAPHDTTGREERIKFAMHVEVSIRFSNSITVVVVWKIQISERPKQVSLLLYDMIHDVWRDAIIVELRLAALPRGWWR